MLTTKNLICISVSMLAIACTNSQSGVADIQKPLSQQMVESHGLGNFDCNRKHKDSLATTGWDYVSGLVASAVLKAYELYPQKTEYLQSVKQFANYSTSESGDSIFKAPKRISAIGESNLDDLAAGKIYFTLYKDAVMKHDSASMKRYKSAATMLRNKLKYEHARIAKGEIGEGGFFHKKQYPNQMWLDGLYMGAAFYAQWQKEFGAELGEKDNQESWSDIALQFKILHNQTYDAEKQLCYHGWSATPSDANSFWAVNEVKKGCSPEFWARGMGWYFAALTDVLELMPTSHPDYAILLGNYKLVADGLKRWQDEKTGLWYQLLQYDNTVSADGKGDEIDGETYNVGSQQNYLESSASCMFTYCFYKGVRLGLLAKDEYLHIAQKAFDGIQKEFLFVDENGQLGIGNICASAGLGPQKDHSRTGTINYYLAGSDVVITRNEGKAIGTFIMAALEKELSEQK